MYFKTKTLEGITVVINLENVEAFKENLKGVLVRLVSGEKITIDSTLDEVDTTLKHHGYC